MNTDSKRILFVCLVCLFADGKQFMLNGNPINFRGTHNGGDFPLTGYPPTDVKSWTTLFETAKKWGLNHMRFHSWCPPEAAFEAADQVGFYLQPEPGMWNEISPGTPMERMLYDETDRMIRAYGNHPSFMLLSASNEPKGKWQESLSKWVEFYRKRDPRRLYASGTGHTERELQNITDGTDYLAIQRINQMMLRRESGWYGNDFSLSLTDINIPVIAHEVGQWVAYPDYDVIQKFKGYLKAGNFELKRIPKQLMLASFVCLLVLTSTAVGQPSSDNLPKWVKEVGARRTPKARRTFPVAAVGDGVTNSTKAIQNAIDACAKSGGGVVTFKPGNYVTGALFLKSNVHLRIDTGVTLLGSQHDADYPSIWTRVAGIANHEL